MSRIDEAFANEAGVRDRRARLLLARRDILLDCPWNTEALHELDREIASIKVKECNDILAELIEEKRREDGDVVA